MRISQTSLLTTHYSLLTTHYSLLTTHYSLLTPSSRLPLRRAHHEPVELVGHLDLAGQARVRPYVVAEVEHVLLHRRRLAHRLAPCRIDMHVAGGTGAGAAAFRLDAGNAVLNRRLHHGRAEFALD